MHDGVYVRRNLPIDTNLPKESYAHPQLTLTFHCFKSILFGRTFYRNSLFTLKKICDNVCNLIRSV